MLWHAGSAQEEGGYFTALMEGFADLGYVEGKTAHFEHRYADEHYERFPAMTEDLMAAKCDVIMASILPAAQAASRLTSSFRSSLSSCPIRSGAGSPTAWRGRGAI